MAKIQVDAEGQKIVSQLVDSFLKQHGLQGQQLVGLVFKSLVMLPDEVPTEEMVKPLKVEKDDSKATSKK